MAITVFSDVRLPNSVLAAGVKGKQMRMNSRVPTDNGFESINVVWTQTLRQFTIGLVPLRVDQWQAIETIHEITEGGAFGFLLEDPKDSIAPDGIVTRKSAGVFQLYKRYVHAASNRFKTRKITRPTIVGFAVNVSGAALAPSAFTLDETTGLLSITANPDPALVTWTGRFSIPVNFMDDFIDWELVVAGGRDARFVAGPSLVLQEIRE